MPSDNQGKANPTLSSGIDWQWDEWRFVWLALRWKLLPWRRKTSWKKVEHVRRRLLIYLAGLYQGADYVQQVDALDETWPQMREMLRKNPALAQFMMEYGVFSEFFYPFLLRIPQAPTLEIACGYGYDMLGKFREIPRTDAMYAFYRGDEMFRWIRKRIRGEQLYMLGAERIMFVGGGLLQALRRNDHLANNQRNGVRQEIVAYDFNQDLKGPLRNVFPQPLEEYGIAYYFQPAENAFRQQQYENYFDVVDASGVLSYREDARELRFMLEGMLRMTRPGGKIVFDLQVLTLTLLFDKFLLNWNSKPSMKPEKNVEAAIELITRLCIELEADVEVINQDKIGVQFAISKRMGD